MTTNTTHPTPAEQEAAIFGRIALQDPYTVSEQFYHTIWWQAIDGLPTLEDDEDYSAEQILEPLWDELARGEQLLAGRCLAHMIDKGKLPPLIATPDSRSPRRYRLKSIAGRGQRR